MITTLIIIAFIEFIIIMLLALACAEQDRQNKALSERENERREAQVRRHSGTRVYLKHDGVDVYCFENDLYVDQRLLTPVVSSSSMAPQQIWKDGGVTLILPNGATWPEGKGQVI